MTLLGAASAAHAQPPRLEVRTMDPALPGSEPRKVVTARFRVTNHGSDGEFVAAIDAAPDWRVIDGGGSFRLAGGRSSVRAVKLQVPAAITAGDYPIVYMVKDVGEPGPGTLATTSVQVSASAAPAAAKPLTATAAVLMPIGGPPPRRAAAASPPFLAPAASAPASVPQAAPSTTPMLAALSTKRPAQAARLPAPAKPGRRNPATTAEALLLEIKVNDLPLPGIIAAERLADGRLVLPAEAWTAARLRLPGEPLAMQGGDAGYALESAAGVTYRLDRSTLTLAVTAPAAAYDATKQSLGGRLMEPPLAPSPGAYLNYDLSATHDRSGTRYGALVEAVAFNSWGALVSGTALTGDERTRQIVRTDTYLRKDFPVTMESLVIGDAIGSGGAWSRPVRYGGIRYARDFTLAPGYITYPMPSISGSAALPSTIDVLINNRRNASSSVQSGPFELTNVPIVTGAGDMQVVVRDMLGRETIINQSYYVAPQLLSKGLSDFSYEAGALRENYGRRSNDYGSVFGAGTYRLGLSDALTGEARAEAERKRVAAGVGVSALVGQLGIIGAAAGYAVSEGEHGGHYLASAQRTTPQGGVSIAVGHFDRGYRQLGEIATEIRPRDQITAGGGLQIGHGMNAGITYTRQTTWDGDRFSVVGVSLGIQLPGNAYLSPYLSKQLDDRKGWSGGLSLIIPLDGRRMVAASTTRDREGKTIDTVQLTQSTPAGPGLGWRVAASDSAAQRLQGGITLNTNSAQVSAEANFGKDANGLRVGANGSVGWLRGLPFASRRIDQGAFAVVQVGDIAGVPVSLSNQVVATTNGNGLALVPGLLPYQLNQITVNPDQLPFDAEIHGVRETAIPYARSGVFVDFPVKRSRDAMVVLRQPDGTPVPAGSRVTVTPGNREFVVAKRGEVYLMDLQDDNRIEVRWKTGGCSLPLPLGAAVPGAQAPKIGPLLCAAAK